MLRTGRASAWIGPLVTARREAVVADGEKERGLRSGGKVRSIKLEWRFCEACEAFTSSDMVLSAGPKKLAVTWAGNHRKGLGGNRKNKRLSNGQ